MRTDRHEVFASLLARGATPAQAYFIAGYSRNNRKARSAALAAAPAIQSRVTELRSWYRRPAGTRPGPPAATSGFACLPLPSPSERGLKLWLTQAATGAITVTSGQNRAARELVRLYRHMHPTKPAPAATRPTPSSARPAPPHASGKHPHLSPKLHARLSRNSLNLNQQPNSAPPPPHPFSSTLHTPAGPLTPISSASAVNAVNSVRPNPPRRPTPSPSIPPRTPPPPATPATPALFVSPPHRPSRPALTRGDFPPAAQAPPPPICLHP